MRSTGSAPFHFFFRELVRLLELRRDDTDFTALFTDERLTLPFFGADFTVRLGVARLARVFAAADLAFLLALELRSVFAALLAAFLVGFFVVAISVTSLH